MRRSRWLRCAMAACGLLLGVTPAAQAQATARNLAPSATLDELETVLIVGEQPGPGMWKISQGEHVLWILPSSAPMPRGMTWRSQRIEARIGESQEVLYPARIDVHANIGLLRALTLVPAALKAGKNPGGATLKNVLDPQTYARWRALREKYIGSDDDVEQWRPAIALEQLSDAAFRKSQLTGGPSVDAVVERAAKKHKVHIHRLARVERAVRTEDAGGMLKAARKLELPDLPCFIRGLDNLEPALERTRARTNAWARGDTAALRELNRGRQRDDDCVRALLAAPASEESAAVARIRKLVADIEWHMEQATVQAQRDWIAAARQALARNRSTFAVLPASDVFSAGGHIEALRALGYTVEEPP